ncbi:MAG TPA: metalloregulator ArsR/SmtB family transcription factor [Gemmatimonadota bacterium]|nr:metalloregulator ArsR/SmtB family transcription factor [Gemmatimonadota bacterium]
MSGSAVLRRDRASACEPDSLFRALGDPTRVRIVNLLAAGELCVCDLVELLGLPQPTISRHLAVLRVSGLVWTRRRGRYSHYGLAKPSSALHAVLLQGLRGHLDTLPLSAERSQAHARVAERRHSPC